MIHFSSIGKKHLTMAEKLDLRQVVTLEELLRACLFTQEVTMAQISPHWLRVQKLGGLVR